MGFECLQVPFQTYTFDVCTLVLQRRILFHRRATLTFNLGPVHTPWMDGVASENRAKQFWARKAESESCGDPTAEGENAVWPDLRRNPQGRGQFSPCLRRCSLQ